MTDLEDRLTKRLTTLADRSPQPTITADTVRQRIGQRARRRSIARAGLALGTLAIGVAGFAFVNRGDAPASGQEDQSSSPATLAPALPVVDEPASTAVVAPPSLSDVEPVDGSAPSLDAVEASPPPLLALALPGWSLMRYDEQPIERLIEYTFSNGSAELDVRLYGRSDLWARTGGEERVKFDLNGRIAWLQDFADPRSPGTFSADTVVGSWLWEFVGQQTASRQAFLDLIAEVVEVDEQAWLSSLPDSTVTSAGRAAAVDQILIDVPLPPGFDTNALKNGPAKDAYQLTAQVTGAIFCRWLQEWSTAVDFGDADGTAAALAAISSSHRWPSLVGLTDGAWNEAIWEDADRAAAGDRSVVSDAVSGLGCLT